MTNILVKVFIFSYFVFACVLCCCSEQSLIAIVVAVTGILDFTTTVGSSTLNICNQLNMLYLNRDASPVLLSDKIEESMLRTFLQSRNNLKLLVFHPLSLQNKVR